MSKRILITGGTGFLGCHLARAFLKKGHVITLLDTSPLEAKDLLGNVTVINADIRNKKAVEKACKTQHFVVHAAAALPIQRTKHKIFSVNVDGTKNVLEAALQNGVQRLVFISSTAVYGVPKHLPENEESPLDPIGYYGESKIKGEMLCQEYMKKGLAINIIRPKTFLGPERLGVFTIWFEAIYSGHRLFILGNGKNKYQLLAVSDIVSAIEKALMKPVKNEIFTIGAKDFQTWRRDLGFVIKHEKSKTKITSLPVLPSQLLLGILDFLHLSPIAAWHYKTLPVSSYVSTTKAERVLGWKPKYSNQQLLLENYLWYKRNRNKIVRKAGKTHRVGWDFQMLNLISKL